MKKFLIALAAVAAAASTPAFAEAPSGIRAEALVGWDRVSLDLQDFGLGSYNEDGVGFAIGLGYDVPVSASVAFGVDAEVADSTTKYEFTDGVDTVSLSTGRDLYVGGRLTAAVNPNLNLYGKVGYTNARIKGTINNVSESDNGDGVRVGLGAQLGFGGSSYGLVEYRYSNYESDVSRNQVMAGVGFRF